MMRTVALSLVCLLLLPAATACGIGGNEPEQVYLASAIGADADPEGGILLSIEVPLTRENEADHMVVRVFGGRGVTPEKALQDVLIGLDKQLLFGHCAVLALGETLSEEQREAVFAFSEETVGLPLSAVVISTPSAAELLAHGSLTASAAGYEIPNTLRLRAKQDPGVAVCHFYEVLANPAEQTLPRFCPSDDFHAQADRLIGVRAADGEGNSP